MQRTQLEKSHGLPGLWSTGVRGEDHRVASAKSAGRGRASGEAAGSQRETGRLDVRRMHFYELRLQEELFPVQYVKAERVGVCGV